MAKSASLKFICVSLRHSVAASLACGALFAADAGAAVDLTAVSTAAGAWEIALVNTERRCGMQLRTDKLAIGHLIGMPAGCRRALPILMEVGAWSVEPGKALEFGDKSGKPVLSFAPADDDKLFATGPEGEIYELIATGRQRYAQANPGVSPGGTRPLAAPGIRTLAPAQNPAAQPPVAAQPSAAAAAPEPRRGQAPPKSAAAAAGGPTSPAKPFNGRPAELSGRYVILRDNGKDVGCMLTLNDQARGPGGFKAQLAPACRDNGIVVFDPLGWQLDRGRLALTARKGHKAMFIYHEDGSWWKDPKEGGKPLGVRKM